MIDAIALPAELPGHLQIAITNKLLVQQGGDLVDYPGIFDEFALAMAGMRAGPYTFGVSRWLIVKATWRQRHPFDQLPGGDARRLLKLPGYHHFDLLWRAVLFKSSVFTSSSRGLLGHYFLQPFIFLLQGFNLRRDGLGMPLQTLDTTGIKLVLPAVINGIGQVVLSKDSRYTLLPGFLNDLQF